MITVNDTTVYCRQCDNDLREHLVGRFPATVPAATIRPPASTARPAICASANRTSGSARSAARRSPPTSRPRSLLLRDHIEAVRDGRIWETEG